ncbi:MAG: hypothetical protein CMF59_14615 [Leptospiraceae bacterium]|nr:hypothetical protein [Leptospiraceae bacterium]
MQFSKAPFASSLTLLLLLIFSCPALDADTVVLKNGQELDGVVTGVTDTSIILETDVGSLVVPKNKMVQVFVGDEYRNASPEQKRQMLEQRQQEESGNRESESLDSSDDSEKTSDEEPTINAAQPDLPEEWGLARIHSEKPQIWLRVGPVLQELPFVSFMDEFRMREFFITRFVIPRKKSQPQGLILSAGIRSPIPFGFEVSVGHQTLSASSDRELVENGADGVNPENFFRKSGYGTEEVYGHLSHRSYLRMGYPIYAPLSPTLQFRISPQVGIARAEETGHARAYYAGWAVSTSATQGSYVAREFLDMQRKDQGLQYGFSASLFRGPVELELSAVGHLRHGRLNMDIGRLATGANAGYDPTIARLDYEEKGYEVELNGTYWWQTVGLFVALLYSRANIDITGGDFFSQWPGNISFNSELQFQAFGWTSLGASRFARATASSQSIQFGLKYSW